jgi:hypothetical protein
MRLLPFMSIKTRAITMALVIAIASATIRLNGPRSAYALAPQPDTAHARFHHHESEMFVHDFADSCGALAECRLSPFA